MAKVMIRPAYYGECLEPMRELFAEFSPRLNGASVLLKPNVLRACRPEEGVTTHPAVLAAVLSCVKDLGAREIIVGDNPGLMSYGANEQSFQTSGLLEAAGAHYRNIGLFTRDVVFDPAYGGGLKVSKEIMDCDYFISLPKFKTHGLTVLSGALKNSYGILPGAQKAELHRLAGHPERFQELIVDVFRLRAPDLFIMDAIVGMQGNGPASTELRFIGRVLGADNAVAMDAAVARMMGLDPAGLRFLQKAKACGLGDYAPGSYEVLGDLLPVPEFKLPPLGERAAEHAERLSGLIDSRAKARPKADPSRCTACGTCVEQCPAEALSIEDGLAVADAAKCIACYCCQEMCPEKAIALS